VDKRIERTIGKAREAAMDVLAERGFAAFTMEAVAEQSGIAKSTLYRHWTDRMALLSDALETLNRQPQRWEPLRKSELRARVIELLEHLASVFEGSRIARIMPALVEAAEHHQEVRTFLHDYSTARRHTLVRLLEEGAALGELAPDVDPELAALALSGPIFYCRFMTAAPFPKARVVPLVDLVLRSAR
jgi:AcrR family transcriptional regulator